MQPPQDPPTPPDGLPSWKPQTDPRAPQEPDKTHHWYRPRNVLIGTSALIVGIIVAGVATGSGNDNTPLPHSPPPHNYNTPGVTATSAAPTPSPTPSPDGKFSGSCDYTLGDNPVGGTAEFIGEVDLDNTGNIGTIVRVKITWPQEGYSPITRTKTVKVPFGATGQAVRFHVPASGTEVDRLQSWQNGHDYNDGCTYDGTITDTYGAPHYG